MSKVHMDQYFYHGKELHTLKSPIESRSIFRAADIVLTEHSDNTPACHSLLATDKQGTLMEVRSCTDHDTHAYTSYGHRLNMPITHAMIGFNGQLIDPVLRTYLLGNGYRAFNPVVMRFSSPDSLSPFRAGGINCYCYCLGDPVNRKDDSGHAPTAVRSASSTNRINNAWNKAKKSGWESVFTDPKTISQIQPNLPSDDVISLALVSKK